MIQARDFGYKETTLIFKRDVLDISLESGIISSFTIFVAINKELNEPVYGPLYHRDIPRPILFSASYMRARGYGNGKFYPINTSMNKDFFYSLRILCKENL